MNGNIDDSSEMPAGNTRRVGPSRRALFQSVAVFTAGMGPRLIRAAS